MKVPAKLLTQIAEDILRVAEDGEMEASDFNDIQEKIVMTPGGKGYQVAEVEIATFQITMCLQQAFYNQLRDSEAVLQ